jgi:type IV pilus assembly protein PilE
MTAVATVVVPFNIRFRAINMWNKSMKKGGVKLIQIQQGFTLIELMIAVVIVAVLAAIAYPSYIQYVVKSKRSVAESFIMNVGNKQEQFMLNARRYATSMVELGYTTIPTEVSNNYQVDLDPPPDNTATPPTYTVTATPTGGQLSNDANCGAVAINQAGTKTISGSGTVANCW